MADYRKAVRKLLELEFSNPENFLHKNRGENDYTVGGIYKFAHPSWEGWAIVDDSISLSGRDMKKASVMLFENYEFNELVYKFYKYAFWDKMKLDYVQSQKIAEELFIFGVNAGIKVSVMKAQKIVDVEVDGLIGQMTIQALNRFDEERFDFIFDYIEEEYYKELIKKKPSFAQFKNGWINRARSV